MKARITKATVIALGNPNSPRYTVLAEDAKGNRWTHDVRFDLRNAGALRDRVAAARVIDTLRWEPTDPKPGSEADTERACYEF